MPKVFLPQILWHSKDNKQCDRVYSIDFQPTIYREESEGSKSHKGQSLRLATGGADEFVHIWKVTTHDQSPQYVTHGDAKNAKRDGDDVQPFVVRILARLVGHIGEVNSVRWSHSGQILATGGEDKCIFLWKKTTSTPNSGDAIQQDYEEHWSRIKYYRLPNAVNSICWSSDDESIAVSTEDGLVSLIDIQLEGNTKIRRFEGHISFAQGVAICPKNLLLASMGSDQSLRIWKKKNNKSWKSILVLKTARERADYLKENENIIKENKLEEKRYGRCVFMSDELSTFFRRLDWSPDGRFLVAPAGIRYNINQQTLKDEENEGDMESLNHVESYYTLYVFHRKLIHLGLPMFTHSSPTGPFVVVKFCPIEMSKFDEKRALFFSKLLKAKKLPQEIVKKSKRKRSKTITSSQQDQAGTAIETFFHHGNIQKKNEQIQIPEQIQVPEKIQIPEQIQVLEQIQAPEKSLEEGLKENLEERLEKQEDDKSGRRIGKRVSKRPDFFHDSIDFMKPRASRNSRKKSKDAQEMEKEYDTDIEEEVRIPRFIFAAGTVNGSLCFYDTKEHSGPIAVLSNLHFCAITDISWSPDGFICATSSSDGYITFVIFNKREFY